MKPQFQGIYTLKIFIPVTLTGKFKNLIRCQREMKVRYLSSTIIYKNSFCNSKKEKWDSNRKRQIMLIRYDQEYGWRPFRKWFRRKFWGCLYHFNRKIYLKISFIVNVRWKSDIFLQYLCSNASSFFTSFFNSCIH